jgi:hypothetical protein
VIDDPNYVARWRSYRRWRLAAIISYLGWVPYGLLVMFTADAFGVGRSSPVRLVPMFAWLLFFAVVAVGLSTMRCPRCEETFFMRMPWPGHWPFAGRCLHCELPKWATCDPVDRHD